MLQYEENAFQTFNTPLFLVLLFTYFAPTFSLGQ